MSTALNGSSRPLAKQPIASSSAYLDHDSANPILASHPTLQATTKWFQDIESEGSDSDGVGLVPHNRGYKHILLSQYALKKWANNENFGGSKLRAPPPVQEETEIVKMGKKRTVIKRKRKRYDEWSDDEDPYSDIKVEGTPHQLVLCWLNLSWSYAQAVKLLFVLFVFCTPTFPLTEILSPLENPSDIVKRSSLRRILKSGQIEFLARTSMEFIESEKNFNKILSRLSNIIQFDDPQYLDIRYDRDMGPGPGLSGLNGFMRPRRSQSPSGSMANGENADDPMELDESVDMEAREILRKVRELVQENINCSNEFLMRFHNARDKLTKAHLQKEQLWKRLKSKAAEQHKKSLPAANAGGGSTAAAAAAGGTHAGGAGNVGVMERERERERDRIGGGFTASGSGALQAYHSASGSGNGGDRTIIGGNGRLGNHDG